jgi:predicted nucleic acid-binding protein
MVLVDAGVWIDYFGGVKTWQTDWLDREAGTIAIGVTDLALCELLQGVRSDKEYSSLLRDMANIDVFDTGGKTLAIATAENYRFLRKRGITVRKTIDCIQATFCIAEGFSLLHRDRDFDGFERLLGLKVVHPRAVNS